MATAGALLDDKWVQLVVGIAVAGMLAALGYYLVTKLRGSNDEDATTTSDVLASFRELHEEGELTDEEFRNIKAKLSARLQQELKAPRRKDEKK